MSWANCGRDSSGRKIGYAHEAVCDAEGCGVKIDRGLDYACGGMHGDDELSCELYFCSKHKENLVIALGVVQCVCDTCVKQLHESGDYYFDKDEDLTREKTNTNRPVRQG